jgi:dynein light intermediate chain 1
VLRDGFDAKAWGEAWEHDLSSDAGVDSDDDDGARKMYASLVQDQGPKVRASPWLLVREHLTSNNRSRPRSHLSTTRRPNKPSSRRTTTRTRARRSRPARYLRTPTDASAAPAAGLVGPLVRHPSRSRQSSVRWRRWGAAVAPRLGVSGDAQAHRHRLYSGARRIRRSVKF